MKNSAGQSLLEVVVALGIIVIVLVGLIRVGSTGVRNSSSAQNEVLSARYGSEVSEWLKSENQTMGWIAFVAMQPPDGSYCLSTEPLLVTSQSSQYNSYFTPVTGCSQIPGTSLVRTVQIKRVGDSEIDFDVTIKWYEGAVTRTADYSTQITNVLNP